MHSSWLTEDEILAYIASVSGCDPAAARQAYLTQAQWGELVVEGRDQFRRSAWQPIPTADWLECVWCDLADPLCTGIQFRPFTHWYDRRARRQDVEALWPLPDHLHAGGHITQEPVTKDERILRLIEGVIAEHGGRPPEVKKVLIPKVKDRARGQGLYITGSDIARVCKANYGKRPPGRPRNK